MEKRKENTTQVIYLVIGSAHVSLENRSSRMIARNKWNVNILLEAPSSFHWWNTIYNRSIIKLKPGFIETFFWSIWYTNVNTIGETAPSN